jgi:hypothetical protein
MPRPTKRKFYKRSSAGLYLVTTLVVLASTGWGGYGAEAETAGHSSVTSLSDNDTASTKPPELHWAKPLTIDSQLLESVSCPTVRFCVSTDDGGGVVVYSDGRWSKPVAVSNGGVSLGIVSCSSPTFCQAIISDGKVARFDGKRWSLSCQPGYNGYGFNSISCLSPRFCMAVGTVGMVTGGGGFSWVFDGARWSPPGLADPGGLLATVSCSSSSFCMALNLNDDQFIVSGAGSRTYDGRLWSKTTAMPTGFGGDSQAVSCLSTRFCAAVDDAGDAAIYKGTWAPAVQIDSVEAPLSTLAVSCAASNFCVAVNQAGHGMIYNGNSWSHPSPVATSVVGGLTGVSCPSRTFCVAVGGGQAVIGT